MTKGVVQDHIKSYLKGKGAPPEVVDHILQKGLSELGMSSYNDLVTDGGQEKYLGRFSIWIEDALLCVIHETQRKGIGEDLKREIKAVYVPQKSRR